MENFEQETIFLGPCEAGEYSELVEALLDGSGCKDRKTADERWDARIAILKLCAQLETQERELSARAEAAEARVRELEASSKEQT